MVLRPALSGPEFSVQLDRINLRSVKPSALNVIEDRVSLTSHLVAERAANRDRMSEQAAKQEAVLDAERRDAAEAKKESAALLVAERRDATEAKKDSATEIRDLNYDNSTKVLFIS